MREMLWCRILGHKFIWTRLVETETSKEMRAGGLKTTDIPTDFIHVAYNTDTCVNCGLTKKECRWKNE